MAASVRKASHHPQSVSFHNPYHDAVTTRAAVLTINAPISSPKDSHGSDSVRADRIKNTSIPLRAKAHRACPITTPVIQAERFIRKPSGAYSRWTSRCNNGLLFNSFSHDLHTLPMTLALC